MTTPPNKRDRINKALAHLDEHADRLDGLIVMLGEVEEHSTIYLPALVAEIEDEALAAFLAAATLRRDLTAAAPSN